MPKGMKILFFLENTAGSLFSQNVCTAIADPCLQRVFINIAEYLVV